MPKKKPKRKPASKRKPLPATPDVQEWTESAKLKGNESRLTAEDVLEAIAETGTRPPGVRRNRVHTFLARLKEGSQ